MDLIKKLTGKNPAEYEPVAKNLVNNSDVELFAKLVKQDDFLFDFIKDNVARRIKSACNSENYQNLLDFLDYYSSSYENVIAGTLYEYGKEELIPLMKELFLDESLAKKAYVAKYFTFLPPKYIQEMLPLLRETAKSSFEPLSINSIEVLSKIGDDVSKLEALELLNSKDEFEQYNAIKFLVTYKAYDSIDRILDVMKSSSLSENIASEIPYLLSIEELLAKDFEKAILVLCNIVNAIPEIISPSAVLEYNLYSVFERLYLENLSGASALLLRIAKDKFNELVSNEEYLFDSDKNTKDEIFDIQNLLAGMDTRKLDSLLYEEMYEGSDFVFFAVDYVDEPAELETLLDSRNQTLRLKVLTKLKENNLLTNRHKEIALDGITNNEIKAVIEVL